MIDSRSATPLDRFLADILPHARQLVADGHAVDPQLVPDAFECWLVTCEEMVAQRTERSQAALRELLRAIWTEVREGVTP